MNDRHAPAHAGNHSAGALDPSTRQEQILDLVRDRGFVSIEALAQHFKVTPQTIRRDINQLCELDLLQRHHGGAAPSSSTRNTAYRSRQIQFLAEKRRIAALVASQIPDGASLFINVGTTTEEVARALLNHRNLRVITNNLHVATILAPNEDFEVLIAGGLVRSSDHAIVGEPAIDFLNQFKVDFAIIGISGIDTDGTLLDFDYREVRAAQTIVANARQVFLAADHSKFARRPMVRLGSMTDLDAFFTDRPPPDPIAELLAAHDVRLFVAAPGEAEQPAALAGTVQS
ncbi:MAG: DeoR family transcriptional regulator [Rhodospirillaceae bacterium]|nr:DeoR family transcriptional regulator [Rhodospirillaceae bacterium]